MAPPQTLPIPKFPPFSRQKRRERSRHGVLFPLCSPVCVSLLVSWDSGWLATRKIRPVEDNRSGRGSHSATFGNWFVGFFWAYPVEIMLFLNSGRIFYVWTSVLEVLPRNKEETTGEGRTLSRSLERSHLFRRPGGTWDGDFPMS
jgi:hypothetical protein